LGASALYLQGISPVQRNNEWHHFDPLGTAQVVSNNVYDVFGCCVIRGAACLPQVSVLQFIQTKKTRRGDLSC